jgi:hypothetical protein
MGADQVIALVTFVAVGSGHRDRTTRCSWRRERGSVSGARSPM